MKPFAAVFIAVLFALLFTISSVGAEEVVRNVLGSSGFSVSEQRSLTAVFTRAGEQEVPPALLLPRLREGIAKNIAPARIAAALQSDLALFVQAREVARTVTGGAAIIEDHARWARAVTLLQASRPPAELQEIFRAVSRQPETFRAAAAVHISLTEWGLSPEYSLRVVQALVASRIEPGAYPGVMELFTLARRQRIRPERTVERIVDGLGRVNSIQELRGLVVE